jgi:hypothetical protein
MQIPQWLKQVGRDVLIALLISILTVLGYSGAIVQPAINQARADAVADVFAQLAGEPSPGQVGIQTLPKKTSHIGELQVSYDVGADAQTAIAVTNGMAIVPTGTFQQLSAAGTVGGTISTTGARAGQLLILYQTSNQTVTITDTSTTMLDADMALTQYDAALLVFDGTNWIEVAHSHN